jgi:protein SCO1/2
VSVAIAVWIAMASSASAQWVRQKQDPPPRQVTQSVGIDQKLNAQVPLDLRFRDDRGREVALGELFGERPVVLALVYYECPMLCTQVLNGLLRALRAIPDTAGGAFNVVVVSFDPREKPPLAALKKAAYLEEYGRPGADAGWHFLTGDPVAIASLTDAVGFRYKYDPDTEQYAHGSGIMVLAPDGTVSRYLLGVRFEPRDLRLALAEAGEGKVGSPADQVLLLCYRYDPATGTYTFRIIRALKWLSGVTVLGVAGLVGALAWRGRRGAARDASATARPAGGG